MKTLTNLYWSIDSNIDRAYISDEQKNDIVEIDNNILNQNILDIEKNIKLKLPYDYLDNYYSEITLEPKKYSISDIMNIVYNYYNSNFSEDEFNELLNCDEPKITDSVLEIIEKNLIKSVCLKNNSNRIDVMGSRVIFEGLKKLNDNEYEVLIGY